MDNQDELLQEIHKITSYLARRVVGEVSKKNLKGSTVVDFTHEADKEILAKVKEKGYEQVWIECPDCNGVRSIDRFGGRYWCPTCNGTRKIFKYVPWDKELVRDTIIEYSASIEQSFSNVWGLTQAIHKILTGASSE